MDKLYELLSHQIPIELEERVKEGEEKRAPSLQLAERHLLGVEI